ncbi:MULTISPECIES: helix-turn-helix domain-containing protein [unclassified Brevibacterium]|uniref:helix-turn-helix domain-containing protein n=1 Tax=unclassified Brevibacterium TaxID=2614124 RepID=UPI001E601048|nr:MULTISPECIES: helix-turn-helix domain-containing protein [unclassified Brevibacterium]MCD1287298.1 DNA-binding protein [Brevibacterium sp. CCUG 69071]MDK8436448.1 helix-turn-helix domain-containing protein [Brevibacterium sp. H-BE7]
MKGIDLTEYFTAAEVAEKLKCTPKHVNTLRKRDGLPAHPLGGIWRYHPAEVKAWIAKQERKAA